MSVQWVETCASPLLCVDYLYKYAEVHATFKTITILDARCNSSTPIRYIYIYIWGHSRLGYYFWVCNGKRTFFDIFTCLVCLDLYCEAYFRSYLHFILHIEYTDKVNLEGIGSSKISF